MYLYIQVDGTKAAEEVCPLIKEFLAVPEEVCHVQNIACVHMCVYVSMYVCMLPDSMFFGRARSGASCRTSRACIYMHIYVCMIPDLCMYVS